MRAAGFEPGPFLALAPTPPKTLAVSEAEVELRLMGVTWVADFVPRVILMTAGFPAMMSINVNHAACVSKVQQNQQHPDLFSTFLQALTRASQGFGSNTVESF